jgi:hypothetical protein
MKLQAGLLTITVAILALPGLVSGKLISSSIAPAPTSTSTPGNGSWEFEFYKNKQCTGHSGNFKGNGSRVCRSDVPSGGAKGYYVKTLDAECTVILYKDSKCSHGKKIENIYSDSMSKCTRILKRVKSWKVKCML